MDVNKDDRTDQERDSWVLSRVNGGLQCRDVVILQFGIGFLEVHDLCDPKG